MSDFRVCFCGAYGGGKHTLSARCLSDEPEAMLCAVCGDEIGQDHSGCPNPLPAERDPVGTSKCPICGIDTPHGHSTEAVKAWRESQMRQEPEHSADYLNTWPVGRAPW